MNDQATAVLAEKVRYLESELVRTTLRVRELEERERGYLTRGVVALGAVVTTLIGLVYTLTQRGP